MGEMKSQFLQDSPRGQILRVMTGEESLRAQRIARMRNDCAGRFHGEAFSPIRLQKSVTKFVDLFFQLVRTKPAATHEAAASEQQDRPELNAMHFHGEDFARNLLLN